MRTIMRTIKGIILVSDEEFNKRFEDMGMNALDPIQDTYACTIRILELKQMWDSQMSLEDALRDMAVISYEECQEGKEYIIPASFYDFCYEVFTAFEDTIDEQ